MSDELDEDQLGDDEERRRRRGAQDAIGKTASARPTIGETTRRRRRRGAQVHGRQDPIGDRRRREDEHRASLGAGSTNEPGARRAHLRLSTASSASSSRVAVGPLVLAELCERGRDAARRPRGRPSPRERRLAPRARAGAGRARSRPARRRGRAAPSPASVNRDWPVEHLEHAERPLVVRAAARPSAPAARSPCPRRRPSRSAGRARRPRSRAACRVASTQPATPVPAGKRLPSRLSSPSPTTASKTSSSSSSSSSRTDEAFAREDRARDLDDRAEQLAEALLGAEDAGGDGGVQIVAHRVTSHVRRGQVQDALQLERRQLGVLRADERADPADVRRREAVARGA